MKKALSVLLALLILFACAVPALAASVYESDLIPTGSVRMTAHRGYSAIAPENTLPAFRLAGEYGFWGAECDTLPTADGEWIIMHDDTVDRMTDGEGKVADLTLEEISKMTIDAGNNVEDFPDTKVPTLTEYLDVCNEYALHPVIEIKTSARVEDMDSLAQLLSAREEKNRFVLITFGRELAARIKKLMPETPVYLLIGGAPNQEFVEGVRFCLSNRLDGIDFAAVWGLPWVLLTKTVGLKIMVWTIDDVETVEEYYRMGVRDFTTNALTPGAPEREFTQTESFMRALRDFCYRFVAKLEEFFTSPTAGFCR